MHSWSIDSSSATSQQGLLDELFPYWSFTKTVIAICAYKLAEEGLTGLDDTLAGKPYTLRQLLQHKAGVPNYGGLPAYHAAVERGDRPWSRDELFEAVPADELLFDPGEGWAYSNIGYMFAREEIERRSGANFADLVRSFVALPLNLNNLKLATTRDEFAKCYWPEAASYDPRWVFHGCLIGTPKEAGTILASLFQGRLLTERSLKEMLNDHDLGGPVPDRPWTNARYGSGLMTGEMGKAGRALGHSGGGPFSVNAVLHFPGLPNSKTIACLSSGSSEARPEFEARRLALEGK